MFNEINLKNWTEDFIPKLGLFYQFSVFDSDNLFPSRLSIHVE